ncbi:hypothetical protein ACVI1L_005967 [Bradyrhizobium sp. USDA 4516]
MPVDQPKKPDDQDIQQKAESQKDAVEGVPLFVRAWLKNPPLLPGESRLELIEIFRSYEQTRAGKAETEAEYWMVCRATTLTAEIMRYERMKVTIMRLQERPAVETMLQKTHPGAAVADAAAGVRAKCHLDADKYYADPKHKEKSSKDFESAGFGPHAVEGEAFILSLPSLATLEKMIASKEKRLQNIAKELEARYLMRAEQRPSN